MEEYIYYPLFCIYCCLYPYSRDSKANLNPIGFNQFRIPNDRFTKKKQ